MMMPDGMDFAKSSTRRINGKAERTPKREKAGEKKSKNQFFFRESRGGVLLSVCPFPVSSIFGVAMLQSRDPLFTDNPASLKRRSTVGQI